MQGDGAGAIVFGNEQGGRQERAGIRHIREVGLCAVRAGSPLKCGGVLGSELLDDS